MATAEEGRYIETVEKFICILHRPAPDQDLPLPTVNTLTEIATSQLEQHALDTYQIPRNGVGFLRDEQHPGEGQVQRTT